MEKIDRKEFDMPQGGIRDILDQKSFRSTDCNNWDDDDRALWLDDCAQIIQTAVDKYRKELAAKVSSLHHRTMTQEGRIVTKKILTLINETGEEE